MLKRLNLENTLGKLGGVIMAEKNNDILNVTIKMNCGMNATCIAYHSSSNIDIKFEDGTIVKHKAKFDFIKGLIKNPNVNLKSCLGEKRIMHNGQVATCINYRGCLDIDVQFEDGTIVNKRTKWEFYNGKILNSNQKLGCCLNETYLQNCGMNATCINYINANNIDVQFEDGTIVKHRDKTHFVNGKIGHPLISTKSLPQRVIFEALKQYYPDAKMNYKPIWLHKKEIDIWLPMFKVGIEYDGFPWHSKETKRSKEKYDLFLSSNEIKKIYSFIEKGCIPHYSIKHTNYLSQTNRPFENMAETNEIEKFINMILKELDRNNKPFVLDDIFLMNVKKNYLTTLNQSPSSYSSSLIGTSIMMNCGMKAKLIAYRGRDDVDVEFEDGTIVLHKAKRNFLKGAIQNPNCKRIVSKKGERYNPSKENTIGLCIKQNCGMNATCIAYRKYSDIDVRFEDGTIVQHKEKRDFLRGRIKNPFIRKHS